VTEYIVYSVQRREEWQKLAIEAWLSLAAVLCRRFRTGDPRVRFRGSGASTHTRKFVEDRKEAIQYQIAMLQAPK